MISTYHFVMNFKSQLARIMRSLQRLIEDSMGIITNLEERINLATYKTDAIDRIACNKACELVTSCKHRHCQSNSTIKTRSCHIKSCQNRLCRRNFDPRPHNKDCKKQQDNCPGLISDGIKHWQVAFQLFDKALNYILSNIELQLSSSNLQESMLDLKLYIKAYKEDINIALGNDLAEKRDSSPSLKEIIQHYAFKP
ncbi:uncharacterized protein TRIADDRAFT_58652 [Trichoplax adhaerens]|uniref:Uncharacterized protein n=1 Tax=Trichoplax adhaerens TaxID=10228 RepID=B3S3A7_TRIAD|nr:predicted protein [Trichoplax adhaerens]EDV22756.1 predicted protein [Trichoplax adhaerens]|eukprot:XP_002114622.1 predicted protein [Trichoplax adhaerens]